MSPVGEGSYPIPEDPVLAEVAAAFTSSGYWISIADPLWRTVYMSDDLLLAQGFMVDPMPALPGVHYFGTELLDLYERRGGFDAVLPIIREALARMGDWMVADTPGGHAALREVVDPRLWDVVEQLEASDDATSRSWLTHGTGVGESRPMMANTAIRIHDKTGRLAGTATLLKPHMSMSVLATLGAQGDIQHFERMQSVSAAQRRPAAILFADLEGSTSLGKRLSTAKYFALGRRLTRAADRCVVEAGGVTGRHAGDGVAAFFVAETFDSEAATAAACIKAARSLVDATAAVAGRSDLDPGDLTMRFGLHWGATLHIGLISTVGRTEVTALGDEANECARIEACATGGRTLASKMLVERLDPSEARRLGLDLDRLNYTQLADLSTATEKARRDAPSIPVTEV